MLFQPLGGSMAPFLCQGDTVAISPGRSCRIGDVVLWQSGEALVLHRMVFRRNGRIITKGDSLLGCDAPIAIEQIRGRAVSRQQGGRVQRLDHLGARFLGLAFSLTVMLLPGLLPLLARVKAGCSLGESCKERRNIF
jgi:hypothetical protein